MSYNNQKVNLDAYYGVLGRLMEESHFVRDFNLYYFSSLSSRHPLYLSVDTMMLLTSLHFARTNDPTRIRQISEIPSWEAFDKAITRLQTWLVEAKKRFSNLEAWTRLEPGTQYAILLAQDKEFWSKLV